MQLLPISQIFSIVVTTCRRRLMTGVVAIIFAVIGPVASAMLINGAGASFPYPLYSKWFSQYRKVEDSVKINYQSIGSGGGIRQFLKGTTDFGASDAPMKDSEMKKADKQILHIPTVLGAVAVTYNIPGVKKDLKLSSEVISKIFLGDIKKWDHPAIKKLNPDTDFPEDQYIVVCHRSDGSGTTAVFTDYLAKVSKKWRQNVGAAKSVNWPTGLGGKGNEGVTGLIKQNPGAIGYVELTYASSNDLPVASVRNPAGQFVTPSVETVSAAAAGELENMPSDYRVSITNADGKKAYPIASFTYLLVHKKMKGKKGQEIVKFLKWSMDEGQEMAPELNYAPLPDSLVQKVESTISSIQVKK